MMRLLQSITKRQWLLLVVALVLVVYLVQMAMAQEETPVEVPASDSTDAPVDVILLDPTGIAPVEAPVSESIILPVEPVIPVMEVLPVEPTVIPEIVESNPVEVVPPPDTTVITDVPVEVVIVDSVPAVLPVDTVEIPPVEASAVVIAPPAVVTPEIVNVSPVLSRLSGQIALPYATIQAAVTVSGAEFHKTFAVNSDGTFNVKLPPGAYRVTFSAAHHLPYTLELIVPEQPLALSSVLLVDGDVDGSGAVDMNDVNSVVQTFGSAAPLGDLNGDGAVNIYDLTIVTANAG
jgi:hypothetical protein